MDDKVSREAKLNAAKEIVNTYIKVAVTKDGETEKTNLSPADICNLFKQVYGTIDETVPNVSRKVGLGV